MPVKPFIPSTSDPPTAGGGAAVRPYAAEVVREHLDTRLRGAFVDLTDGMRFMTFQSVYE